MYRHYRTDPLTEREKAHLRRVKDIQPSHGAAIGPKEVSKPNNERDFLTEKKAGFTVSRLKRGSSGCRMSKKVRAMVEARTQARAEFFAALKPGKR